MRCPSCDAEYLLGQDTCDSCGVDLTEVDVPGPKRGRLHRLILKDPISQLNAPSPIVLGKSATVADAVQQMREKRYGSVLVVDDAGKLSGIVTERDILMRTAIGETAFDEVSVADVMTPDPGSLDEDAPIAFALNLMSEGGYRHVAIVRDEQPIGFCSVRGILRYIAENALE